MKIGTRRWLPVAAGAVAAAALAAGAIAVWVGLLGPAPLGERPEVSTAVVDRNGRLLRPYATSEGRWRLPARSDGVDPRYLALLTAYEDKRFRDHAGVDVIALLRAAAQMVTNGHIVSGASTLTMQVARLLEPRPKGVGTKLFQMVRALQLEERYSKDEILSMYQEHRDLCAVFGRVPHLF